MSSHRSLIVVLVALLCGVAAAPASANPGFEPLGGPQIGLPGGNQARGALAVHHGRLYVAVIERALGRSVLRVEQFDPELRTWQPVGGPVNVHVDEMPYAAVLDATERGDLYVAWAAHRGGASHVAVARLAADGRGWDQIAQTDLGGDGATRVWMADMDGQPWVAWQGTADSRIARVAHGQLELLPRNVLPAGADLRGLVAYRGVAYAAYTVELFVPSHPSNEDGGMLPDSWVTRLRVARLVFAPDPARVEITHVGGIDAAAAGAVILTGGPDPVRRGPPVMAWEVPDGIELMRLREDGTAFVPIALPVIRPHVLQGLAVTPDGIALAAAGWLGDAVRVHLISGSAASPAISVSAPRPDIHGYVDLVAAPPGPASDGAIVMSYVRDAAPGRRVAAAVRYSP